MAMYCPAMFAMYSSFLVTRLCRECNIECCSQTFSSGRSLLHTRWAHAWQQQSQHRFCQRSVNGFCDILYMEQHSFIKMLIISYFAVPKGYQCQEYDCALPFISLWVDK